VKVLFTNAPWHALHTLKIITLSQNCFHLFMSFPDISLLVSFTSWTHCNYGTQKHQWIEVLYCFLYRQTLKFISSETVKVFTTVCCTPFFKSLPLWCFLTSMEWATSAMTTGNTPRGFVVNSQSFQLVYKCVCVCVCVHVHVFMLKGNAGFCNYRYLKLQLFVSTLRIDGGKFVN